MYLDYIPKTESLLILCCIVYVSTFRSHTADVKLSIDLINGSQMGIEYQNNKTDFFKSLMKCICVNNNNSADANSGPLMLPLIAFIST